LATNEAVYGLVLAGGQSKRMGRDKALLRVDGETQLSRAVSLLEPLLDRVFVSTRVDQQEEPERKKFDQIVDRYRDLGPLAGILAAMATHPDVGWLVLACDLPHVDTHTIQHLLDDRSPEHPFTAYKSSYDGLPEPLCAFYSAGTSHILKGFADDGIFCPRKILIRSDTYLIDQVSPESLDNINTPEDLEKTGLKVAS
jgi:molybdopterin-guanine dinucleotide biosynthesis protein A